jgi:hypothetical protein
MDGSAESGGITVSPSKIKIRASRLRWGYPSEENGDRRAGIIRVRQRTDKFAKTVYKN